MDLLDVASLQAVEINAEFQRGKDMGHCGATLPLRVNQLRGISDDHTEVFDSVEEYWTI